MSQQQDNGALLAIIAVILIAILGLVGYQVVQEEREPDTAAEAIGQSMEQAGEDMQDAAVEMSDQE